MKGLLCNISNLGFSVMNFVPKYFLTPRSDSRFQKINTGLMQDSSLINIEFKMLVYEIVSINQLLNRLELL